MNLSRVIHFRDQRPPQMLQFDLERQLMSLMRAELVDGRLTYSAEVKTMGATYAFRLVFEAVLLRGNAYSLSIEASWGELPESAQEASRKSAAAWMDFWTQAYLPARPVEPDNGQSSRYSKRCAAALAAEAHLDSVPAVQQAILDGLRQGASFATAHKEGGTRIRWTGRHFQRADYGESNQCETFPDDATFLAFLRRFYDWETSRNVYPDKVPDWVAWKLILRLLRD